jgi:hypothetical protein
MNLLRRRILVGSAALAACATSVGFGSALLPGGAQPRKVILVLQKGLPAGESLTRWGAYVRTHSFENDVTELLYQQLVPYWRDEQGVVAGITGARAFFCLETVALDHGVRVVFRNEEQGVLRAPMIAEALNEWQANPLRRAGVQPRELLPSGESTIVSWVMAPRAARAWRSSPA